MVRSSQPLGGLDIHSGLTPRGLPLSDAAKTTAADFRHKSAVVTFIFYTVCGLAQACRGGTKGGGGL